MGEKEEKKKWGEGKEEEMERRKNELGEKEKKKKWGEGTEEETGKKEK
jgi:hypothetical protein